nr:hypothetical protein [Streptomyces vilmorinianum]
MTSSCCAARSTAPDRDPPIPRPDRAYAELIGGPLDGLLLDITGRSAAAIRSAVAPPEIGTSGIAARTASVSSALTAAREVPACVVPVADRGMPT